MTSLSRVIKKGSIKGSSICNVNYEALIGAGMEEQESPPVYLEADGFKPLFFNEHLDVAEHDEEDAEATEGDGATDAGISVAADIPDGMLYVAEEDLQTQLTEAYQRGVEEGRQAAERGLAHVFRALRDGADSLVSLRERVLRDSESDLLKLSSLVAKKIILQEIALDPAILGNIIAATVSCCSEQDRITIRLSPDDYRAVMANRQSFSGVLADEGRVTLAPDDSIMLGGCLVETPTGTVDARIESQLDEVFARCMEQRGIPQESLIVNSSGEQGL
ncbi:flagellar assembly protein FliH [Geobacter sp. OR-1]|uniref:FliH/SctL family protein n=1 Tax=Geobacter sp. OR-1 TaxID=1266765 RepID=UPI0005433638|nr:FliH/SctL family protein [Geobacter sp. OR-1]GAM09697.1 flagellar assembly protein FliH [Geobacter sp. OR-1]